MNSCFYAIVHAFQNARSINGLKLRVLREITFKQIHFAINIFRALMATYILEI